MMLKGYSKGGQVLNPLIMDIHYLLFTIRTILILVLNKLLGRKVSPLTLLVLLPYKNVKGNVREGNRPLKRLPCTVVPASYDSWETES